MSQLESWVQEIADKYGREIVLKEVGRPTLMKEFGLTDYKARKAMDLIRDAHQEESILEEIEHQEEFEDWSVEKDYYYNQTDDVYVIYIPSAGRQVGFPGDFIRELLRAYSNWDGHPSTVAETLRRVKTDSGKTISKKVFMDIRRALGVTHDSAPFSPEEIRDLSTEELLEDLEQQKTLALYHENQKRQWKETERKAKKWDEFEYETERFLSAIEGRIVDQIRNSAPAYVARRAPGDSGNLLRLHVPDLHLGKPGFQSGWTIEEAEERVLRVVGEFTALARLHGVDQISIPLGHDFFHIDREHASRSGTLHTTGSGTPIERTVQWGDLFIAGCRVGKRIIEACLEVAPVHVNMVPGNHDEQSVVALGEVMRAEFSNSPDVVVVNDSLFDKYFQWGACGFMDTHGHTKRFEELPLHFALSNPELWGSSRYREVNTGHKHISKKVPIGYRSSEGGCMIYISPSLSPQDYWHRKFGYFGMPGAEAHLYHKERGSFAHYERFF